MGSVRWEKKTTTVTCVDTSLFRGLKLSADQNMPPLLRIDLYQIFRQYLRPWTDFKCENSYPSLHVCILTLSSSWGCELGISISEFVHILTHFSLFFIFCHYSLYFIFLYYFLDFIFPPLFSGLYISAPHYSLFFIFLTFFTIL